MALLLRFLVLVGVLHVLSACASTPILMPADKPPSASATLVSTPLLRTDAACSTQFQRTDLPHTTTGGARGSALYASNGAGVAVGDLNSDGLPDLVYGNISGTTTIFLNKGAMQFRPIATTLTDVRALAIVDVDGDGRTDLVATRRFAAPVIGHLEADTLVYAALPGVYSAFYAMGWQDLNHDGQLDVVFGTYDNEQLKEQGLIFQTRGGGGVFVYTQNDGQFTPQRLTQAAQALAIAFPDLDHDGRADVYVGNDFNTPDDAWIVNEQGYTAVAPFPQTTENTMSLDSADTDNDGTFDLYATDMKPYRQDVETLARWLPAMGKLTRPLSADDPQYTENTLYRWDGTRWYNTAYTQQLDATGWSWSATFGDLDNNGWQDLFVVNGMKATDLLNYLPNAELTEHDMLFATDDGQTYTITERGLGDTGSGRAAVMADLDLDGDLDVVVNPIDGPAQLYENRLCATHAVEIRLLDRSQHNRAAIGATLRLTTSTGTQSRQVTVGRGYLSGTDTTVHFGIADPQQATRLVVTWPDGAESTFDSVAIDQLHTITREDIP